MLAFGKPGLVPNWSSSKKTCIGTAIESNSRVWFTVADGILTEVFYPRIDQANIKDFQFIVTETKRKLFLEEKNAFHQIEYIDQQHFSPAYRIISTDKDNYYQLTKSLITNPENDSLLMQVEFKPLVDGEFHLYGLLAPHLENNSHPNSGHLNQHRGRPMLVGWSGQTFLSLAFSAPVLNRSCGYVGFSDGWQDLRSHNRMEWIFDEATDGNIALTAEIDLTQKSPFVVVLAFSTTEKGAMHTAQSTLNRGFANTLHAYVKSWGHYLSRLDPALANRECKISAVVLRTHEDKTFSGGMVASLSIPWGESAYGNNIGGYHLVWPRDLCQSALGLIALGDIESAMRALNYLATIQKEDGSWPQNCWLDGSPYWEGVQLDETAYPIILAFRLLKPAAINVEAIYRRMVRAAAIYLTRSGPVTPEDRWEEDKGYSPSTLAVCISALTVAGEMALQSGDLGCATYFQEVADYWWSMLDSWTYTTNGRLMAGHTSYYERIDAVYHGSEETDGNPNKGYIPIKNLPPNYASLYPKYNIIDGGFIDLVRFGLKRPDDPHILNSLVVYDAMLKTDTPFGPVWHRYNHDGYGETSDGSPYQGSGQGRGWPLLTGERGQLEIAAGRSAKIFLDFMEKCAQESGLIPEQVWDQSDLPEKNLFLGRATGSARPLVWAHAEYIKLYWAQNSKRVFDLIDPVYKRYILNQPTVNFVFWKKENKVRSMPASYRLMIESREHGDITWSTDGWQTRNTQPLSDYGWGSYYVKFEANSLPPDTKLEFSFNTAHADDETYVVSLTRLRFA